MKKKLLAYVQKTFKNYYTSNFIEETVTYAHLKCKGQKLE